jgi:Methyltransferase domain
VIYSAPISTRNQWGTFLTDRGLVGNAVEIGTHRAEFAKVWMTNWLGRLWCVDPWKNLPDYESQVPFLADSVDREEDYRYAWRTMLEFRFRYRFIRKTSRDACPQFLDRSLDCVYIDGNHVTPHPENDLNMWWPKVKEGGIISGHDFLCPGEIEGGWGKYIQPAVLAFSEKHQLDLYLVIEEGGCPWTYYMVKPKEKR